MNIETMLAEVPTNSYVIVGCMIVGFVMKHWIPTDNKIIPTCLVILGALMGGAMSGWAITTIISGALGGVLATGLHQNVAQYIEWYKEHQDLKAKYEDAVQEMENTPDAEEEGGVDVL